MAKITLPVIHLHTEIVNRGKRACFRSEALPIRYRCRDVCGAGSKHGHVYFVPEPFAIKRGFDSLVREQNARIFSVHLFLSCVCVCVYVCKWLCN